MRKICLILFIGLLFLFNTSVFAQDGSGDDTIIELTDEELEGGDDLSCRPAEAAYYGRNCTEYCGGVTYDTYDNGNAKKCCEGGIYVNADNEVDCCVPGTAEIGDVCISCDILEDIPTDWQANCDKLASVLCTDSTKIYTEQNGVKTCCPGIVVDDSENPGQKACIINTEGDLGINMNADCLINGQCSYNIYKTLGIRKSDPDPSVGGFVQDVVLAAATFIGTVIAIVLVTSGILYIIASIKGSSSLADMAKKGLVNSVLGLLLVASSYAIVRLIQFFATAGGG